jgi:hypothetical protein
MLPTGILRTLSDRTEPIAVVPRRIAGEIGRRITDSTSTA